MPWLFVALLFRILIEPVIARIRARRKAKPSAICTDCFYAHVQYGAKAQRSISCTYGGFVRPMKLDVLYCTDYRTRNVLRTRDIGFVREIATAEYEQGAA
jgi:hypothetical protein